MLRRNLLRGKSPLAAFRRDRRGATAVEFALIALPFFAVILAILETAIIYFADNALDTATNDAARLVRTGQAQAQKFDATAFRDQICASVTPLLACSGLKIDVRTSADFSGAGLSPPLKADGTVDVSKLKYDAGHGKDIVVVRAYYEWPAVLNLLSKNSTANGTYLLASITAFRNEPFTW